MTIIWNHHEKCIQISTNMPGIGSLIVKYTLKFQKFKRAKILLHSKMVKPMPACLLRRNVLNNNLQVPYLR